MTTTPTPPSTAHAANPHAAGALPPATEPPQRSPLPGWAGWLVWLALLAVLLAVFGLYMQPDFLLTLADQLWSCL